MTRAATILAVCVLFGAGSAWAQTPTPTSTPDHFYGEVTGGATFGSKVGGSIGGELGYWLTDKLAIFVEGGRLTNVTQSDITSRANATAAFIGGSATATQKANYINIGMVYKLPLSGGRLKPYVVAGAGGARLIRDSHFTVNGADVTGELLGTYGVQLGSDLSGHVDKLMVIAGLGARLPFGDRFFGDIGYRYGYIAKDSDTGLPAVNTNRLQFGFGLRF